MEDFTLIKHPFFSSGQNNLSIFPVFDGHGGEDVAKFLKNNFCENLEKTIKLNLISGLTEILKLSIENINKNIEKIENMKIVDLQGILLLSIIITYIVQMSEIVKVFI